MPQDRNLSRRDALKTLAAATGAVALTSLPVWEKPVVKVGALPAHAQSSALVYFSDRRIQPDADPLTSSGPSAVLVTVQGNTAHVLANDRYASSTQEIYLNIDGTPSSNFSDPPPRYAHSSCAYTAGSSWSVTNYTPGVSITITTSGGKWEVKVPAGSGSLPDLVPQTCED